MDLKTVAWQTPEYQPARCEYLETGMGGLLRSWKGLQEGEVWPALRTSQGWDWCIERGVASGGGKGVEVCLSQGQRQG